MTRFGSRRTASSPTRRRTILAAAAIVVTTGLALTACSSSPTAAPSATSDAPVEGGTLVFGLASDTSIIDPHITGSSITATIARNVVDSLVGQAEDNSFTPWLAERWEVNSDNTLYTFHLRSGVTFSDGTTLDAAAVKTNLDRVLNPATNSGYAKSLLGAVTAVTAVDDSTVTVAYAKPFAPLLQGLSLPYLGIQSPKHLADTADTSKSVVGSGPFILESFAPGQGTKLTKRADYDWAPGYARHTGAAHLDGIEFRILPEASTRLGALTNGQVQAIDEVPPANYAQVTANPALEVFTYENPGVNYAFQLNTQRAPFDDVRVRQALQSAADIPAAVNATFFGTLKPADNIVGPRTLYYDPSIGSTWGFDAAKSARLLDEAGWTTRDADGYRTKDGQRLSARWVYDEAASGQLNTTLVQAIQSQVKEVGFDLVLDPVDAGTSSARSASGDYDISAFFFVRAEPDILRTVYSSVSIPPSGGNASRINTLDAQLTEAVGASDERRKALYQEVQRKVVSEAYAVPLYVAAYQLGHSKRLKGITWATNAKPLLYDAWLVPGA